MHFLILKSKAKKRDSYECNSYVELTLFEYFLVIVSVAAGLIGYAAVLWWWFL